MPNTIDKKLIRKIQKELRRGDCPEISRRMKLKGLPNNSIHNVRAVISGKHFNADVIKTALEIISENRAEAERFNQKIQAFFESEKIESQNDDDGDVLLSPKNRVSPKMGCVHQF